MGSGGMSANSYRVISQEDNSLLLWMGKKSELHPINTGVPQGSVLGPLFFLLYINDITNCINDGKTTLFADDTSLLLRDKNLNILKKSQRDA